MSFALGLIVFVAILAGLIALGVRAWRGRHEEGERQPGEVIPYLLLALALGVTVFSLAELAAAALVPDRFAGEPATRIAGSLAGIVVAGPIALLIWRRQAERREAAPQVVGWPVYLALIDLVFLTAFFSSVESVASAWFGEFGGTAEWTDLVIFGGVVAFHWWARLRETPRGEVGALPLVTGSAVSLVAMAAGLVGTLDWLFSLLYRSAVEGFSVPDPATPIALLVFATPIWAWRWLRETSGDRGALTGFYLGAVSTSALTTLVGAGVAIVALLLGYLLGQGGPARSQFQEYPVAFALALVAGAVFFHHRARLDETRRSARRGYGYAMAAVGLGASIGTGTALVDAVFGRRLTGTAGGQALITIGVSVLAAGAVWWRFWRRLQTAPRPEQLTALPRRLYLVGGSVAAGLVAAGALIGTLVIVFQALLGEEAGTGELIRVPAALTVLSGLALWHLFLHLREDNAAREQTAVAPFPVTLICSDPGDLAERLPGEARLRIVYRDDSDGVVDEAMAAAIAEVVGVRPSLVWVDESGFRVAPARQH